MKVVDGGDLDINFEIISPQGKVTVSDRRQEDGLHNVRTEGGGDFQFCFDNSFSRMSNKVSSCIPRPYFKLIFRSYFLKYFWR